jgi:hypothetical protein
MGLMELNTLMIAGIVSALLILFTIYKTATSSLSQDRKIAVYITTLLAPIIGFIMYFIFMRYSRDKA